MPKPTDLQFVQRNVAPHLPWHYGVLQSDYVNAGADQVPATVDIDDFALTLAANSVYQIWYSFKTTITGASPGTRVIDPQIPAGAEIRSAPTTDDSYNSGIIELRLSPPHATNGGYLIVVTGNTGGRMAFVQRSESGASIAGAYSTTIHKNSFTMAHRMAPTATG